MDYRTIEQLPLDELREIHRRRLRNEPDNMIAWCHRLSDETTAYLTIEVVRDLIKDRETRKAQLVLELE